MVIQCRCKKHAMNFLRLKASDLPGGAWECEECSKAVPAQEEPAKAEEPKEESKAQEKAPESEKPAEPKKRRSRRKKAE